MLRKSMQMAEPVVSGSHGEICGTTDFGCWELPGADENMALATREGLMGSQTVLPFHLSYPSVALPPDPNQSLSKVTMVL